MSQPLGGIDLSKPPENIGAKLALAGGAVFLAILLSWLVLNLPLLAVVGLSVGGIFAAICLVNPFVGLLGYTVWEFVRPAEIFPVLAPLHLQRGLAIVLVVAWLSTRLKKNAEPLVSSTQNKALGLLLLTMVISVPFSVLRGVALDYTIDFAKLALIYIIIANLLSNQRRINTFALTMVGVSAWVSITAIYAYFTGGIVMSGDVARTTGIAMAFSDPNDIATLLSAVLPFVIFLLPACRNWVAKGALGILVALCLAGIACTGSRGGTLALAAVIFALWIRSRRKVAVGLALAALMAVFWVAAPSGYRERLSAARDLQNDPTVLSRRVAWQAGWYLFLRHPLLGVGAGDFGVARANSTPWKPTSGDWHTAHSIYFQLLAELGIGGLIFFLWLMTSVFRDNRTIRRRARDNPELAAAARIANTIDVSLIGLLVGGTSLSLAYYPVIYFLAAVTVAQYRVVKEQLAEEEPAAPAPEPRPAVEAHSWR